MPTATCSICFEELLCASNPTVANKIITNTLNISETPKPVSKYSSTNSLASTTTASTTTGCIASTSDPTYGAQPSAPFEFSSRPSTATSATLSAVTDSGNVGDNEGEASSASSLTVSATPCGHVFHTTCVAKWIDQHRNCPTCRQPILTSSLLVKLFLAEDKVSSSSGMALYGSNCGATAMRPGYERHPSWFGLQNNHNFGGLANKPHLPLVQRPHSTVGSTTSPIRTSGEGHWSSQRGDVNAEETKIIMDVMQCQMEDLEGECQTLRKRLLTVEDQLQTKVEEVSALEAKVTKRRSISMSEDPDVATTSQNLAIAMLGAGSSEAADRSPVLKNKRRRSSSISNIQQTILELRREYDNLQTISTELRTEIQDLNGSMQSKDTEISSKEHRINELEERNRQLSENMEANSRFTTDLRGQLDTALSNAHRTQMDPHPQIRHHQDGSVNEIIDVYSLYETIMDDDSEELPDGFQHPVSGGRRGHRSVRPGEGVTSRKRKRHCCLGFCKCMKCSFLIAFVLIICVGLLVILPLKIIFSEDRVNYNF